MHGFALSLVKHAHLNGGLVGVHAHFAAKRVYFAHDVTLARAAYGRVARHKGYAVQIKGQHNRFKPQSRAGKRGFATGVSRADYGDVVMSFNESFHIINGAGVFARAPCLRNCRAQRRGKSLKLFFQYNVFDIVYVFRYFVVYAAHLVNLIP